MAQHSEFTYTIALQHAWTFSQQFINLKGQLHELLGGR
jgi:hypothetical protein